MRVGVFVANYNQSREIEKFLNELAAVWPVKDTVIVDDGSTDGSDEIARRMGYQVLKHDHNRGVGAAIRTALNHLRANNFEAAIAMSSNGKMVPGEIASLIQPLLKRDADYVTGNRYAGRQAHNHVPWFRRVFIPVVGLILLPFLGRYYRDITCGFRAYKLDFLYQPPVDIGQPWLDRYEMEYYIHYYANRLGLRIAEVPVTIRYKHLEPGRRSKIRPFVDWTKMIAPIPLLFFKIRR